MTHLRSLRNTVELVPSTWGSSGRRFKSCQPDQVGGGFHAPTAFRWGPTCSLSTVGPHLSDSQVLCRGLKRKGAGLPDTASVDERRSELCRLGCSLLREDVLPTSAAAGLGSVRGPWTHLPVAFAVVAEVMVHIRSGIISLHSSADIVTRGRFASIPPSGTPGRTLDRATKRSCCSPVLRRLG